MKVIILTGTSLLPTTPSQSVPTSHSPSVPATPSPSLSTPDAGPTTRSATGGQGISNGACIIAFLISVSLNSVF